MVLFRSTCVAVGLLHVGMELKIALGLSLAGWIDVVVG